MKASHQQPPGEQQDPILPNRTSHQSMIAMLIVVGVLQLNQLLLEEITLDGEITMLAPMHGDKVLPNKQIMQVGATTMILEACGVIPTMMDHPKSQGMMMRDQAEDVDVVQVEVGLIQEQVDLQVNVTNVIRKDTWQEVVPIQLDPMLDLQEHVSNVGKMVIKLESVLILTLDPIKAREEVVLVGTEHASNVGKKDTCQESVLISQHNHPENVDL